MLLTFVHFHSSDHLAAHGGMTVLSADVAERFAESPVLEKTLKKQEMCELQRSVFFSHASGSTLYPFE